MNVSEVEIILTSEAEHRVPLSRQAADMSKVLRSFLEEEGNFSFPVPHVRTPVMEVIVRWLEEYKSGERPFSRLKKPLPGPDLEQGGFNEFDRSLVTPWDLDFSKEVLSAANFLDIEPLLELAAARVGSIIKGTSIEKLKALVGVKEFTLEWEEEVRRKNPWCKAIQKPSSHC
jgi:S-phase kinase-associated protein 1